MLLITHPDNVKKIERMCVSDESFASQAHLFHSGYKLIECTFMPATRPSGMYSINGSGRFKPEDICVKTRFVTYGPEDLEYLVYAGIAREIQEMNILCMHETQFDFFRYPMKTSFQISDSVGVARKNMITAIQNMWKDGMIPNIIYRHPAMYLNHGGF
mgnify:CR=1 FL=1